MSYVDRSETKMYTAGALLGLGGGYILSRFLGAVVWIPLVFGGATFALLKRVSDKNVAILAAISALVAQTGWFLVGAIAVPHQASLVIVDMVINFGLLAAIFFRPGYISAGVTVAWGLFSLMMNVLQFPTAVGEQSALMSIEQRAMLAHIALRLVIIASAAAIMIFKANPDLLPASEEEEPAYN